MLRSKACRVPCLHPKKDPGNTTGLKKEGHWGMCIPKEMSVRSREAMKKHFWGPGGRLWWLCLGWGGADGEI
jgi:hypothetical protein